MPPLLISYTSTEHIFQVDITGIIILLYTYIMCTLTSCVQVFGHAFAHNFTGEGSYIYEESAKKYEL